MTPKEKAKQLIDKFFEFNHNVKWDRYNNEWIYNYDKAKQCALIAVDEIIPIVASYQHALPEYQKSNELAYWKEVKQEIEKL